jgi:hypothetical protein
MTQEDKKLLLQDLGARLSYGLICSTPKGNGHLCSINQTIFGNEYGANIEATKRDYFNDDECDIKPYLRPMSSMTKEERKIYAKLLFADLGGVYEDYYKALDYLNSLHIDYRGLIEKGLAIPVTDENNPYKE